MSMERRALLAFVASMLLFLAYDALYLSPRMEKKRERERALQEQMARDSVRVADSLAAVRAARGEPEPEPALEKQTPPEVVSETAESRGEAPPSGFPVADTLAAKTVTVASDLYEITMTTNGAEVVSARLLKYSTAGEPVDLFWQDSGWSYERVLNVTFEGRNAPVELHGVAFDAYQGASPQPLADGARIQVDPRRESTDVVFRATTPDGRAIERTYTFYPDQYDFETSVRFSSADFPAVEAVRWGFGPGISTTELNQNDDFQNFKASVQIGEEFHRLKPSHFGDKSREEYRGTLQWASLQTKYFLVAIVPPEPTRAEVEITGAKDTHRISGSVALPTAAGTSQVTQTVEVYFGPLDFDALEHVGHGLDKTIELGWRFIRPVSWVVLKTMIWMHGFIPNYGWVIVIISILTKVLFYRLTHKSFKSMKQMQDLQPRLQALKDKYGDDRQKLSQETMRVYKEAGVNPLGGCLPMLLQMPVFVALFNVLKFTIELRGAPFVLWINDLSQQDVLFQLPVTLPLIGDAFSLLPILMGASMFAQSKLGGSPTGGPSAATPPGFQTMLPIVFTVLFYRMPSGLVIYWIINTVLSVAQQYYIHRQPDSDSSNAAQSKSKGGLKSKGR